MGCNQILDRYIEQLIETSTPQAPAWNIEKIRAGKENTWNYIDGCMIKALIELYEITGEQRYLTFADDYIDFFVQDDGTIKHYNPEEYNLDNVNAGKTLYKLYDLVGKPKYRAAMDTIYRQLETQPRTKEGVFWHKAAVAKSLKSFADALEGTPEDEFQDAALEYCKKVLTDHQRILFSGDGYSDEWPVEAEKRGLANNKTTADALPAFVSDKAIALFEETGVLTKAEAQCRYDCKLEKYNKLMNIEATTMVREARRTYRPVITAYATKVAKGLETIRAAGAEAAMQCEQNTLNKLCNGITTINDSIKALDAVHQKAEALDGQEQANVYAHEVVPAMDALRAAVDAMEEIVAADYWPVPTYDDILFYV